MLNFHCFIVKSGLIATTATTKGHWSLMFVGSAHHLNVQILMKKLNLHITYLTIVHALLLHCVTSDRKQRLHFVLLLPFCISWSPTSRNVVQSVYITQLRLTLRNFPHSIIRHWQLWIIFEQRTCIASGNFPHKVQVRALL